MRGRFLILAILLFLKWTPIFSQIINETQIENLQKEIFKLRRDLDPVEGIWTMSSLNIAYDFNGRLEDTKFCEDIALFLILKNENVKDGYNVKYFNSKEDFRMQYLDDFIDTEGSKAMIKKNTSTTYNISMPNFVDSKYNQTASFSISYGSVIKFKYYMDPTKKYTKEGQREFDVTLTKSYPIDNLKLTQRIIKSLATGFALTQDGYLVTNYHVIENADQINIYGVNGDFNKSYKVDIVASSQEYDLAILKIIEPYFKFKKVIPYSLELSDKPVGTSTYTLGYPMTSLMGNEIKITDGIKSSNTGFRGNEFTFQISIPIQSGNSGSPLFTKQGELIGIITSKLTLGENVSYAIKMKYLKELILSVYNQTITPSKVNILKSKNLIDQIKYTKDFVFIIEAQK